MSTFWSGFIIVLTVANILGCWWLLRWTAKHRQDQAASDTTGHTWDGDLAEYNNPLPRWWLWLFYITIVFGFIYLALYPGLGSYAGMLGWTQEGQHAADVAKAEAKYGELYAKMGGTPIPQLAADAAAMQTGKRLFGNNCAVCHGADGRGAPGFPNLADNDWLYGGSPEAIKHSIVAGRQGVMPGWEAALGDQGVQEVAAYVYGLNGRNTAASLAEPGKQKFAMMCASCHGADGKGMQAIGAPDLTDSTWLYGGSLVSIQESIRKGRNGIMPAHKDLLGEDRAHIVAAYVYSLSADGGKDDNRAAQQ